MNNFEILDGLRHAWLGGVWTRNGMRYRLADSVLRIVHNNRLVLSLYPMLKAVKTAMRLEPAGTWKIRQYRSDPKRHRPLQMPPTGVAKDSIRKFLAWRAPAVDVDDCTFI